MTELARLYVFPPPSERERRRPRAAVRRSPIGGSAASWKRRSALSFPALMWAWSTPARGVKQHVLLALADEHRRDSGDCHLSTADLVEKTGLSERTIRRAIGDLLADGLIEIGNPGKNGRAAGGRRVHPRYVFVVRLETRPERPPFVGAKIVIAGPEDGSIGSDKPPVGDDETRPERPPFGSETRPQRPPSSAETRPNLHGNPAKSAPLDPENPATVAPLSLRDTPGTKPGTTPSAATAAAEDQPELFPVDKPAPVKAGRSLAVAKRKELAQANAGDATAAWCDAYSATHDAKPTVRQTGQVSRECRLLLEAGNPPDRVVRAAGSAGSRGLATVEREYNALAKRRDVPQPAAHAPAPRPSTTDQRTAAAQSLKARFPKGGVA